MLESGERLLTQIVLPGYVVINTIDICFRGKVTANMELHGRCMFKGCSSSQSRCGNRPSSYARQAVQGDLIPVMAPDEHTYEARTRYVKEDRILKTCNRSTLILSNGDGKQKES